MRFNKNKTNQLREILHHYGYLNQYEKTEEECHEFLVALGKIKNFEYDAKNGRFKSKCSSVKQIMEMFDDYLEEMADLLIMLEQNILTLDSFNSERLNAIIEAKINRTIERIKSEPKND